MFALVPACAKYIATLELAYNYLTGILPRKSIVLYNEGFHKNNGKWEWRKSQEAKF